MDVFAIGLLEGRLAEADHVIVVGSAGLRQRRAGRKGGCGERRAREQVVDATADISLGWRSSDDKYGVEAFVTNVSNEAVLNYAAFGSITLLTNYEPPRFYGVRFSFRK